MENTNFSITHTTKGRPPRLPFLDIKNKILGKKYRVGLVFIGTARSRALNRHYRNKNRPANILTFPLSKNEGEIFMTMSLIKKEQKQFDASLRRCVARFFIHGLLHLKGLGHATIEKEKKEEFYLKKFGF